MAGKQEPFELTVTPSVINVFTESLGSTFTADQLRAIADGTILSLIAPTGCITALSYEENGQDLSAITFDGGLSISTTQAENLNDFRERLQEAANFGHGVTLILDSVNKKILRLNIFPCTCLCEKKAQPISPAVPVGELSQTT